MAAAGDTAEEKESLVADNSLERLRRSDDSGYHECLILEEEDPCQPRVSRSSSLSLALRPSYVFVQRHLYSLLHRLASLRDTRGLPTNSREVREKKKRRSLVSLIHAIAIFLVPSFLQSSCFPAIERKPVVLHPTSWLDGIRGFAALFVFFYHYSQRIWGNNDISYGGSDGDKTYTGVLRLPILRIVYAGPAAVSVFFVISGFALSIRPVSQMRKHDRTGLMNTLSSATLRRALRLFLPCIAATLLDFTAVRIGLFEVTRSIAADRKIFTGVHVPHMRLKGSFWDQLTDWVTKDTGMIDIFRWDMDRYGLFENDYDKHLWTIPIEFRCSLVLFLTQLALSNLSSIWRMLLQTLLTYLSLHTGRWDMMLFWTGGILAELYQIYQLPRSDRNISPQTRKLLSAFVLANFLTSLFLLSYPRLSGKSSLGFVWITSIVPEAWSVWQVYHFWQGIGSVQLVASVGCSTLLSRIFSSAPARYLGQISFSLYLVHGLVNHTSGYLLLGMTYGVFGSGSDGQDAMRFLLALALETLAVIWVADMFWRGVDLNTVRLGRWLEGKMKASE